MSTRGAVLALIALVLARSAAGYSDASPWDLPAPGACDAEPPRLLLPPREDVAPASPPKPGETITNEHSLRLRDLLPPELWEKRDRFLFDGMHMQVGPCYRDYGLPAFFVEATERLHGAVTLN